MFYFIIHCLVNVLQAKFTETHKEGVLSHTKKLCFDLYLTLLQEKCL